MKRLLLNVVLVVVGGLVGYFGHVVFSSDSGVGDDEFRGEETRDQNEVGNKYEFISPILACGDYRSSNITSRVSSQVEKEVKNYIDSQKQKGKISDASVYYKDLSNGPWALVNGELQSFPGSLLKVPLAFSVYSREEDDPGFLNSQIEVTSKVDADANQIFQPQKRVEYGKTYTVRQLLELLLAYSDNSAALSLVGVLSPEDIQNSYLKLGIETPLEKNQNYKMNVRSYASFFRILYNASFLTKNHSEEMLMLLSQSKFTQGIVAGVPKGTVVAHKFGERTMVAGESRQSQLHDCGIVYKKDSPYIMCIMTHGDDFETLSNVIADISRIVYNALEKTH